MRTPLPRTLAICIRLALSVVSVDQGLAAERVPVTSIKPLLLAAIDAGEAHGDLIGEAAQFMRERFNSTAAIEIDVKTIATLRETGCNRLEVTTRQAGVKDAASERPVNKALIYQVSYCRDGRFPDSK